MQVAARQLNFEPPNDPAFATPSERNTLKKFYFYVTSVTLIAVAVTVAIDYLFLDLAVREMARLSLVRNYFFALVFGMPHVVASFLIFLMPSYLIMYKTKMIGAMSASLVLTLLSVGLVSSLVWDGFFWVFTFIHGVGQQLGIRRLITGGSNPRGYNVWRISLTLLAVMVFFNLISYFERNQIHLGLSPTVWMAILGIFCISMYFYLFRTSSNETRLFEALNLLLYLGAGLMVWLAYPFLVVILLRVTHDLLAFYVYASHNIRKGRENQKFSAYVVGRRQDFLIAGISLLAPISIYWALTSLNFSFIGLVFTFLSLGHYFVEGFFWKKSARPITYVA